MHMFNSLTVKCWSSMHSKNRAKEFGGEKKRFVNIINTTPLWQGLFFFILMWWNCIIIKPFLAVSLTLKLSNSCPPQAFHDFCSSFYLPKIFFFLIFYFTFVHASLSILAQVFLEVPQSPCQGPAQLGCVNTTLAEVVVSLPPLQPFPFHSSILEIFHFFLSFPLRLSPRALCTFQLQIFTTSLLSSPVQS